MSRFLNVIIYNPYRILGVYANSPRKDLIANKGRLEAFLKVDKSISFPLDLSWLLPPLDRTTDMITKASDQLVLPQDKVKFAHFWFIKKTNIDEIAFNHLKAGDIKKAKEIWNKDINMSSLQNLFVLEMICADLTNDKTPPRFLNPKEWATKVEELKNQSLYGSISDAINNYALKLYDQYVAEFVTEVSENYKETKKDYMHTIIDTLQENTYFSFSDGNGIHNKDWVDYLCYKRSDSYIKIIEDSIDNANQEREKNDPLCALSAGLNLIKRTQTSLGVLRDYFGEKSLDYQLYADRVAMCVIDCMVAYYNKTKDFDASAKALPLCEFAVEIAKGVAAKERAQKNRDTVKQTAKDMPPQKVQQEARFLHGSLEWLDKQTHKSVNAFFFIQAIKPKLVSIKEKLGKTHPYYLKISSELGGAALNYAIEEVNYVLSLKKNGSPISIPVSVLSKSRQEKIKHEIIGRDYTILHYIFKDAWEVISYIKLIDKTKEFENQFQLNLERFNNLVQKFGFDFSPNTVTRHGSGPEIRGVEVDQRFFYTDEELFASCESINDYYKYLKEFPEGHHLDEANDQINRLKELEENEFHSCKSISDYEDFILIHPSSSHRRQAEKRIQELHQRNRIIILVLLIILFIAIAAAYFSYG